MQVEAGCLRIGQKALIQPTGAEITISNIFINEVSVKTAKPGENVKMQVEFMCEITPPQVSNKLHTPTKHYSITKMIYLL